MESLEERLHSSDKNISPRVQPIRKQENTHIDMNKISKNPKYIIYDNFHRGNIKRNIKKECSIYTYCILSVIISFILGFSIAILTMGSNSTNEKKYNTTHLNFYEKKIEKDLINREKLVKDYTTVSFTGRRYNKEVYPKIITDDMKEILKDNKDSFKNKRVYKPNDYTVLYDNIYWGPEVENAMPQGYGKNSAELWENYVNEEEIVKMEAGCGRMQNRLVTFKDGVQACVRYRQNTDQIQGEIFSFYIGMLLNLTNLAPSVVKVVDVNDKLWRNVATDIGNANWYSNRAVVLTQYIPSLESASIPDIFKPNNRHLNKFDVLKMSLKENDTETSKKIAPQTDIQQKDISEKDIENFRHIDMGITKKTVKLFLELAQWSDLIIFDYLTANLDRMVNNLFNFQWNINIMQGPAHNLARKMDSGLLVFLDNESGLLHGYRLLKKYNKYHSILLDNLCVFRKKTVNALKSLYDGQNVGVKLSEVFHEKNNAIIRDILPPLPEKNAKILHERIGKVLGQIEKCAQTYR